MEVFRFIKRHCIISAILFFIILACCYVAYFIMSTRSSEEGVVVLKESKEEEKEISNDILKKNEYSVDIKGEVNSPGVYTLEEDKRIIDVIELAGGLTKNADVSVVNLSRKIFDEMVIVIYSKLEVKNFQTIKKSQTTVQKECVVHIENITNNSCIENEDSDNNDSTGNTKISLNNATLADLMTLSGIGESRAKAIMEYREKNGGFKSVDELKNVSGIGEATFEKLKDLITI